MWRRVASVIAIAGMTFTLAVACTPPSKPTVSLTWQPFVTPTSGIFADGVPLGQDATYTYKAANFPVHSRVSLQRMQGGSWTTVKTAFASKSGTGITRPPLGRNQYRLVLSNFSGTPLASARQFLDVYDNFPFSTIFSIPRKHLNGYHVFDYDFRDFAGIQKSSCLSYEIVVNNESSTPETLRLTYTELGRTTPTVDNIVINRNTGSYSIGRFTRPGSDWSITSQGADLYIEGTGTCYTSNGETS
jgi:hypothetical protein